jgi:gliding motility-associated lipoprotein GldB
MQHAKTYLFLLSCLLLAACSHKKEPDLSNIKLEIKIERFDQDMQTLNAAKLSEKCPELQQKYGWFYADYMEGMLSVGPVNDTTYYQNLHTVLNQKDYQALAAEVAAKYPDLKKQEEELTDAFKRIKYHFPKQKIPRLISFLSGFAVQTPIGNDYIGIGLDMFLGADSKFYPALVQSIPMYISRRFTPENIRPRVIEAFVREDIYPEKDDEQTFLDKMVYNGKVLYLMQELMPDVADSTLIGYTDTQLKWCETYESDIWAYYMEENLLFETDYLKIQKYLTDAPFTPGLGEGQSSAPKLGIWTGWQIVKKYMDEHPEVTMQQLLTMQDAQKILKESKYKPK